MNPIRSTELAMRFAGEWSPVWLLVVLPVVVAVAAWLLRGQFPDVRRPRALGLAVLRLLLLALVAVLAFRPDLVLTETLTWPGRVIVLVDNSASMGVADPALPTGEALRLARTLDATLEPRGDHDRAETLLAAADVLTRFEPVSRDGDRDDDAFWTKAEAAEKELGDLLAEADQADLLPRIAPLFGGRGHAGGRAFAEARDALAEAAAAIRKEGDAKDGEIVSEAAAAAAGLTAALADMRGRSRIDLVQSVLARLPKTLPEQRLEVVPLIAADVSDPLAIHDGGTDVGRRIAGLLADPDPEASGPIDRAPINAIVVVGDGRDTASPKRPPAAVLARLAERKTPALTCGVGGTLEPTDLAVLNLAVPPIVVAAEPVNLAARIKTAVAAPATATVLVRPAGSTADPLAQTQLALDGTAAEQKLVMPLSLAAAEGPAPPQRLAVEIAPVPGEVVPADNNRQEFVVAVRPEPVRVLLLDAVPRWETRFAINTFERMPFVETNTIVASTRPQGQLARGVQRGAWPADEATLGLFSVIVLGRLPDDMLTREEQEAIDRWVTNAGGTLVRLAADKPCPIPVGDWQLRRTQLGMVHPLTRGLPAPLLDDAVAQPTTAVGQSPLLVTLDPAGGPSVSLIAAGRDGKGKRVTIATDELWRVLNPRSLDAHTGIYAELVEWAALAAAPEAAPEADVRRATDRLAISVALPAAAADGAEVEIVRDEETVAKVAARGGVAILPPQPAGTLRLRLAGSDALSQPVEIVADDPERKLLGRNDEWLTALATQSGGRTAGLVDLPRIVQSVPPRAHVERLERVWRPWNSGLTIAVLAGLLILEWIWRKWEGLV
jgi:hypothetical protein